MYEEYYFKEEIQEIYNRIENRARSRSRPRSGADAMCRFNNSSLYRSNSRQDLCRCSCTSSDFVNPCGEPRKPNFSTYTIRCPTPPPIVERFVERCPTPEPDVIERVIVKPQPQRYIERVIEKPRVPPPVIINKEVSEAPKPPIYKTKVVEVDYTPRPASSLGSNDPCTCCCDCFDQSTNNKWAKI